MPVGPEYIVNCSLSTPIIKFKPLLNDARPMACRMSAAVFHLLIGNFHLFVRQHSNITPEH